MSKALLVLPAIAAGLGTWQVFRKQQKEELIAKMEAKLGEDPVPLPTDLSVIPNMEYTRVKLTGSFLHDQELLVGPRTRTREAFAGMADLPESGFHVITPFVRSDANNEKVLIDRGYIPGDLKEVSTRLEGQTPGEVTVEGYVRLGESKKTFTPENNPDKDMWHWIDVNTMAESRQTSPVLVDAVEDATPESGYPLGGQTRIQIRNEHMQYIITWYGLSAATLGMWFMFRGRAVKPKRVLPPKL
eukprot:m.20436 g.20436  ORF g.20436 m.20436 type:complete len:244 (-) comp8164_c0_seq1:93-824(-)